MSDIITTVLVLWRRLSYAMIGAMKRRARRELLLTLLFAPAYSLGVFFLLLGEPFGWPLWLASVLDSLAGSLGGILAWLITYDSGP